MELSNVHTHTTYCDGKNSVEEMVRGALNKGFTSLGFSGHAHTDFGDYEMTSVDSEKYVAEILRAKEKYAGQIDIFCGIEQDSRSDTGTDMYEYIIGATHGIALPDGGMHNVDYIESESCEVVNRWYSGDFYSYAEEYFALEAKIAEITKCDVIAHFDLITKYNENGRLFNEAHPRYRDAAIASMEEILKSCCLFEVNTGAMYRVGRTVPYPAPFLLKELLARGGEVIITSDSHDIPSLGYKFAEMEELLRSTGFKYRKILTPQGFVNIDL